MTDEMKLHVNFHHGKRGPKPIHVEFPEIIEEINHLLTENGIAADKRRRKEQIQYFGTSLHLIQEHLLSVFPKLKEKHPKLNPSTIAHLMPPPRIGTLSSHHYYSLIDARPCHNENSSRIDTTKAHECAAMVKFLYELFSLHSTNSRMISGDKKNLVIMGEDPCVSRYIKTRKFFLKGQEPKSNIHDFSHLLKIAPYGYLDLKFKDGQKSTPSTDYRGKVHYSYPHTGDLYIFNQAASKPFKEKNIKSHYHHLNEIFKRTTTPSSFLYIVDRGSDNDWKSFTNFIYYGKLWFENKMDAFVVSGHAAGNDQFNLIERLWSPMTNLISGLKLSDHLPNEGTNPKLQKIPEEEKVEKLTKLFPTRMEELSSYWNGYVYDGHRVYAEGVPPNKIWNDLCDDKPWEELLSISSSNINSYIDEIDFIRYLVNHCDKQPMFLSFLKCDNIGCHRCRSFGPDRSGMLIEIIRNIFNNKFPTLQLDGEHCPTLDDYLQKKVSTLNSCSSGSCDDHNYVFDSRKDQERHWLICHDGKPTVSYTTGQYVCNFIKKNGNSCSMVFDSLNSLNRHKRNEDHIKHRPKEEGDGEAAKRKRIEDKDKESNQTGKRVKVWYENRGIHIIILPILIIRRKVLRRCCYAIWFNGGKSVCDALG